MEGLIKIEPRSMYANDPVASLLVCSQSILFFHSIDISEWCENSEHQCHSPSTATLSLLLRSFVFERISEELGTTFLPVVVHILLVSVVFIFIIETAVTATVARAWRWGCLCRGLLLLMARGSMIGAGLQTLWAMVERTSLRGGRWHGGTISRKRWLQIVYWPTKKQTGHLIMTSSFPRLHRYPPSSTVVSTRCQPHRIDLASFYLTQSLCNGLV